MATRDTKGKFVRKDPLPSKFVRKTQSSRKDQTVEAEKVDIGCLPEATQLPVRDPWAHRSAGMQCRTCMWFVAKGDQFKLGRCRRHSPSQVQIGFPVMFPSDYCGDHKLDETKI